MVNALNLEIESQVDYGVRQPATVAFLDARLSVWGQATREAIVRRSGALIRGAVTYVEHVGRNTEVLRPATVNCASALLGTEYEPLVQLATGLLPSAVQQSCRLLWIDPDRLQEQLGKALNPAMESAKAEIRRRQALYRRRARLWQNDQSKLDDLRIDLEALTVPRCRPHAAERVALGLLLRHRTDAFTPTLVQDAPIRSNLAKKIKPSSLNEWIKKLTRSIETK